MDNRTPSDHVLEVVVFMIISISLLGVLWLINEFKNGKGKRNTENRKEITDN